VRNEALVNNVDDKIIRDLIERPLDTRFRPNNDLNNDDNRNADRGTDDDEDILRKLEIFQHKNLTQSNTNMELNSVIFNETHTNIPLKEYIRKWSNWVIDFHWVFTLKFFIDSLPTDKLYNFIKLYPTLDNFILHWMWWSYTLSKDLERFTNDPFCAAGTMPWLTQQANMIKPDLTNALLQSHKTMSIPPSKYYQYTDSTIMFINSLLFPNEPSATAHTANSGYSSSSNDKANGLSNRTKSFNVNPLKKIDVELNNLIKLAPAIKTSCPANRGKRLVRSKSCNVLLDETVNRETREHDASVTMTTKQSKRKSLSKSTTSSPYVNVKDKINVFANKTVNFRSIKLNYANKMYELQSNEFNDAVLKRLDSQSTLNSESTSELTSSLENLVEMVTADSDDTFDNGEDDKGHCVFGLASADDDQDKTIVFEVGCCNNDSEEQLFTSENLIRNK
jgi:hypothetical protein